MRLFGADNLDPEWRGRSPVCCNVVHYSFSKKFVMTVSVGLRAACTDSVVNQVTRSVVSVRLIREVVLETCLLRQQANRLAIRASFLKVIDVATLRRNWGVIDYAYEGF